MTDRPEEPDGIPRRHTDIIDGITSRWWGDPARKSRTRRRAGYFIFITSIVVQPRPPGHIALYIGTWVLIAFALFLLRDEAFPRKHKKDEGDQGTHG
ncbi:MAG TPA: hypothetical protein VIS06_11270 [Mycobacteriales bacterium]|jgi:hypothetical protein